MRMGMRRYTRLTNGFSKKFENHAHQVALYFFHYNFCRVHQTLRVTPAMEAGLTDHVWSLEELCGLLPIVMPNSRIDRELVTEGTFEQSECQRHYLWKLNDTTTPGWGLQHYTRLNFGSQNKKRPGLLRVVGRPNSPPPELLDQEDISGTRACKSPVRANFIPRKG